VEDIVLLAGMAIGIEQESGAMASCGHLQQLEQAPEVLQQWPGVEKKRNHLGIYNTLH
jgi:hypothetical protein